jgi:xanthine dehydrogenase YagT iron-sulfur-binding subunit
LFLCYLFDLFSEEPVMAREGKNDRPPGGFSRRDFLRGSAMAGALGTGLLAPEEAEAAGQAAPRMEEGVRIFGPGPVPMRFRINGKPHEATLEPRVTLLDALRDSLGLTGAKRVCDRGTCGACTVILDGKAVYACSVLAIAAQELPIQTVESLGRPGKLHPIQEAFVENDALQCGFCTPGFVMAAKALLDQNPNPGAAEIHRGLSGNFCRCGTYAGLKKAVLFAAKEIPEDEAREEEEEKDSKEVKNGKDDGAGRPPAPAKPGKKGKKKKKRGGRPRG